jgi:hypothetical protein
MAIEGGEVAWVHMNISSAVVGKELKKIRIKIRSKIRIRRRS